MIFIYEIHIERFDLTGYFVFRHVISSYIIAELVYYILLGERLYTAQMHITYDRDIHKNVIKITAQEVNNYAVVINVGILRSMHCKRQRIFTKRKEQTTHRVDFIVISK